MRRVWNGLLAAGLVVAFPASALAQDEAAPADVAPEACSVTLSPIHSVGQAHVTATFDHAFGEVTRIKGPDKAGFKLVQVTDPQREEMAAEAGAENVTSFYVDASWAEPGSYELKLENASGETCSGELVIKEPIEDAAEG